MTLNFFQLFLLIGIIMGIVNTIILVGIPAVKRRSNVFLACLIICFVANVSTYWLRDVGIIDSEQMQLIFIPWQLLVAPLFLIYVDALKIFSFFPFRQWLLFIPFGISMVFHTIVKLDILSSGIVGYVQANWVRFFYLAEEYIALLYCLVAAVVVFRWISQESKSRHKPGFGINRRLVHWIIKMIQMGVFLTIIWIGSLYYVKASDLDFQGYYILWSSMLVVTNIMGFTGIFYSLTEGRVKTIQLQNLDDSSISTEDDNFQIVAPHQFINEEKMDALLALSTMLFSCKGLPCLTNQLENWLTKNFTTERIEIGDKDELIFGASEIDVPLWSNGINQYRIKIKTHDDAGLSTDEYYLLQMATKAFQYHLKKVHKHNKSLKINPENKVYRTLVELIEQEELFTNPKLSLNSLAQRLAVSPGYLSKVINDAGRKNFNEFVNDYRVEKVKQLMKDKSYEHYTITGYGLEAGFNSKSTFYKAFQKREGVSPGKYQS